MTHTDEFNSWLTGLRRRFHRNPELSGQEYETTATVARELSELGVEVTRFDDATGAVGLVRGRCTGAPFKGTIALRADMDALPLKEMTGRPFASETDGVMHACGHDANTAIALGVARRITESNFADTINGAVKFIFQPSEERLGGALSMIERGALDHPKVDRIIAGHMDPNFPVGKVGVFNRIGHAASDAFELTVRGKGSHGARPFKGRSPITAAALFVSQLDTIVARKVPPVHSAVISVGAFNAGSAPNVIPETATVKGTIRTHDPDIRQMIFDEIRSLANGVATLSGTAFDFEIKDGAPMGINDEAASASLKTASIRVLGQENVTVLPFIMGSDDFYFYGKHCAAAMMRIGSTGPDAKTAYPLHSPNFDIDERVLEKGVDILFEAIKLFFERPV